MASKTKQNLLTTKTFWGGLAGILVGVGLIVAGDVPSGINAIITGVVAVFIRDGIAKVSQF